MMGSFPWLVVSSTRLDGFAPAALAGHARPWVYATGWADKGGSVFDVDTASFVALDQVGSGLKRTVIRVSTDVVMAEVSMQDRSPVYLAVTEGAGHVVLGTDLPTTAAALNRLSASELEFVRHAAGPGADTATPIRGIHRLAPGTTVRAQRGASGWSVDIRRRAVPAPPMVDLQDPLVAGRAQLEVLRAVVGQELQGVTEAGVLVSGGVDSSVVAALLVTAAAGRGVRTEAFTVGTPWGDEFADAALLERPLAMPVTRVRLDEDALRGALAGTVRLLGHTDPECVAIGLAPAAFLAGGHVSPGGVLFTGYGSDLVNSGMATSDEITGDITAKVLAAVDRARYTNELSGLLAHGSGVRLAHPYWAPDVLDVALRTAAEAKRHRGREKGHLRAAAAEILPQEIAWQRKTPIHEGNGIALGLARLVDGDSGCHGSTPDLLRALLLHMVTAAVEDPMADMGGARLYSRALATVRNRARAVSNG